MRLLYCYVQFLDEHGKDARYRGLDKIELNFSTVDRFEYVRSTGTLHRHRRKCPLPEHFWNVETAENSERLVALAEDTNIYNINVISGENGSGKTTVMRYLIDLLDGFHAAVDPDVRDHDRMDKLGVAGNRALLLLESDGKQYLLNYSPFELKRHDPELEGFPEKQPCKLTCSRWQDLAKTKNNAGKTIAELLRKTKVIYLNNTLSQRDYERHISDQNERLRDFFVYDASIGSTIGPDVSQFFPYEVYKQARYVFDKNQADKRIALRDRARDLKLPYTLRLPDALRLRLRMELMESTLKNYVQNDSSVDRGSTVQIRDEGFSQTEQQLSTLLGYLCVAAYVENLRILADGAFRPQLKSEQLLAFNQASSVTECVALLENIEKQFDFAVNSYLLEGHEDEIACVTALREGYVISASHDGSFKVWDADTGDCLHDLHAHGGAVKCVGAMTGGRVVIGVGNHSLEVWDVINGQHKHSMWGHKDEIWCVTALSDGRVVSGSRDGTLIVWDGNTGAHLCTLEGHPRAVCCVATLPDGHVVSGSRDRTIKVWDINNGDCVRTLGGLDGHTDTVWCVTALSDGRVVSGSHDRTLKLWNVETGACLRTWQGHGTQVTCVAALPGGRIVSGSRHRTLKVWNVDEGKCLRTLDGHGSAITCVATLPDGRIVSGSHDGSLRIWLDYLRDTSISENYDGFARQRDGLLNDAKRLQVLCRDYVQFLSDKNTSLFSHFRRIDEQTFELSLEKMKEDKADALYTDLMTFMQYYRYTCEPTYTIDFDWGLSSGEENMLRIFSNLYHIFDRDYSSGQYGDYRIYNNESHSDDDSAKTPCDSVLLIMDEADLTLHPEWQRRLINILATFMPQVYPLCCAKDMQLILSTHSPLLLGDIPSENITYLPPKEEQQLWKQGGSAGESDKAGQPIASARRSTYEIETFGQNIHTILKESFFLTNGTVGVFAGNRINSLAVRLRRIIEGGSDVADRNPSVREAMCEIKQNISIVAHGVLRTKLQMLYRDAEAAIRSRESAGSVPSVQQLLYDARALSKADRDRLLEALSRESEADD